MIGTQDVFRVRHGEAASETLARIACDGSEAILAQLRKASPDADAVHEIRKLTKRLRAVGRLFRDEVGAKRVRRVGRAFRDVARALSTSRDAAVRVETLDALADRFAGVVRERAVEAIRREARAERARAARGQAHRALRPLVASVVRARDAMARWRPQDDGWAAIEPGLGRIRRRGRDLWRVAATEPTVANLHEWRKRAKDLRYALELLEPAWPDVLRPFAKAVDELADTLGRDHDLAMLVAWLDARKHEDAAALAALAETARRELLEEAAALGARIHSEPTKAFVRRLGTWWDVWSSHAAEPERAPEPVIRLVAPGAVGT